ncbi:hypothetical protein PMAYCL1PPCAC_02116 [Pristionchus mayeri]|uniref:Uncharacterized protein n=1 Tax=Pristionchus mayeri TaxID=1317129 RepID=A0AAN4Z164_9BILA|nr:hypothetical protein PMAYCL1PPCAC_02116 [Pristionchus mayeri]
MPKKTPVLSGLAHLHLASDNAHKAEFVQSHPGATDYVVRWRRYLKIPAVRRHLSSLSLNQCRALGKTMQLAFAPPRTRASLIGQILQAIESADAATRATIVC